MSGNLRKYGILFSLILLLSMLPGAVAEKESVPIKSFHKPISIVGKEGIEKLKKEGLIKGNGTFSSPYVISDLKISADGGPYGIYLQNVSSPIIIKNCTIMLGFESVLPNSSGAGIGIYMSKNVVIENVTVMYSLSGIYLYGADNVTIKDCIMSSSLYSIYAEKSHDLKILGCVIKGALTGIHLINSDSIKIFLSVISYSEYGIKEEDASNVTISFTAFPFDITAMFISPGYYNLITNSLFYKSQNGICGLRAFHFTVRENEFYHCFGYAVAFYKPSAHNLIYENNFEYNRGSKDVFWMFADQAFDNTGKDLWNLTIGNFWLDWAREGDKNKDGIVDLPYMVAGGSSEKDWKPLVSPLNFSYPKPSTVKEILLSSGPIKISKNFSLSIPINSPSIAQKPQSWIFLKISAWISCLVFLVAVVTGVLIFFARKKAKGGRR